MTIDLAFGRLAIVAATMAATVLVVPAALAAIDPPAGTTSILTFNPTGDAMVKPATPDTNYGRDTSLGVDDSPVEQSLLKFTVAGADGKRVARATLRLFVTGASQEGGILHRVGDTAWNQDTVTWANAPAGDPATLATFGAVTPSTWLEVDLTTLISGDGEYAVRMDSDSPDGADFSSNDTPITAERPQLVVTVADTSPSPSDSSTTGPTPESTEPPPASTLTIDPSEDAVIRQDTADTNYGDDPTLRVDHDPVTDTLIKFDVQGVAGRAVTSVALRLFNTEPSTHGGDLHPVGNTWSEKTVTWANAPVADLPAVASAGAVQTNSWTEIELPGLVTADGIYSLRMDSTAPNGASYSSTQALDPNHRPQLVLTLAGPPIPTSIATSVTSNSAPTSASTSDPTPKTDPPATTTSVTTTSVPTVTSATTTAATASPTSTTTTATPPPGRVTKILTFVEENHSLAEMQAGMPYLYSQATTYGYATNYTAIRHPSLPNYLAIAGGSTYGVTDDAPPSSHPIAGQSVFGAAITAGQAATSYQESMTSNCQLTNSGRYAVKHNPWAYFTGEHTQCQANDVPSGSYTSGALHDDIVTGTLPTLGEVTPNLDNDAHDGSLATADTWLKNWLTLIYGSPDWKTGHLAVIVLADEDDSSQGNKVLATVIHPSQSHRVVTTALTHYSLTGLLTQLTNAPCINEGCTAADMAAAFALPLP